MKNKITQLIFLLLTQLCYSQNYITITQTPQVVPDGKKWILQTNQKNMIEVSNGSLKSGTLCNADLFSNPRIITTIIEGDYGYPNQEYSILFKELEKVPYANYNTFIINPLSIVNNDFDLSSLKYNPVENVGKKQITFMPGQKLFVVECLRSIQLLEINLNQNEIEEINIKLKESDQKLFSEKIKTLNRAKIEEEIKSYKYDLKLHSKNDYDEVHFSLCKLILDYFLKSKENSDDEFPSFSTFDNSKTKFVHFKNTYNISYLIEDENIFSLHYGYELDKRQSKRTYRKIELVSGNDTLLKLFKNISLELPMIIFDGVEVYTKFDYDKGEVDFARGITKVRIRKGKIDFIKHIPDIEIQKAIIEELTKNLSGLYILQYDIGTILGKKYVNIKEEKVKL
jgi:hypothetical protein